MRRKSLFKVAAHTSKIYFWLDFSHVEIWLFHILKSLGKQLVVSAYCNLASDLMRIMHEFVNAN